MLLAFDYTARAYMKAYGKYATDFWENMTPGQYGGVLIFIAVCGWLLMRSSR